MNRATMTRNESRMTPMISRRTLTRLAAWTLAPFAVAGLAVGAPAIAQSANALASVQSHLKSTSSMTADFVQTDRNRSEEHRLNSVTNAHIVCRLLLEKTKTHQV